MKLYLSGKIGGLSEAEYKPKFYVAKRYFESLGHEVVSPLDLPHKHDRTWSSYMLEDLAALAPCDGIVLLHDWEDSPGAKIEAAFAYQMGKYIKFFNEKG